MKYIQSNLTYMRAIKKLTQKEVAQATGIGQKTLSALETGASQGIEFNTLIKLCTFFRCTPSELLLIEEEPENIPPSLEALNRADGLITRGLKAAMEAPEQNSNEVWAEFDAMRDRLKNTIQPLHHIMERLDILETKINRLSAH